VGVCARNDVTLLLGISNGRISLCRSSPLLTRGIMRLCAVAVAFPDSDTTLFPVERAVAASATVL
jgi:hypothetical protein